MRLLVVLALCLAAANASILDHLECIRRKFSDRVEEVREKIQEAITPDADAATLFEDLKNVTDTFKEDMKKRLQETRDKTPDEDCSNIFRPITMALCKSRKLRALRRAVIPLTARVVKDLTKTLVKHAVIVGKALAKVTLQASKFPIQMARGARDAVKCFTEPIEPAEEDDEDKDDANGSDESKKSEDKTDNSDGSNDDSDSSKAKSEKPKEEPKVTEKPEEKSNATEKPTNKADASDEKKNATELSSESGKSEKDSRRSRRSVTSWSNGDVSSPANLWPYGDSSTPSGSSHERLWPNGDVSTPGSNSRDTSQPDGDSSSPSSVTPNNDPSTPSGSSHERLWPYGDVSTPSANLKFDWGD